MPLYLMRSCAILGILCWNFALAVNHDASVSPRLEAPMVQSKLDEKSSTLVVRLFLVRHGATEANEQKLVVGQLDSPLSKKGIQQATALRKSDMLGRQVFWRKYCSDLGRTQETMRLVLGFDDDETLLEKNVILDKRLRELAKGAREGLPKITTYEDALKQVAKDEERLLESEQNAWDRIYEWMYHVVRDALHESRTNNDSSDPQVVVLVMTHAGVLRTLLSRLVPEQLPSGVDTSPVGRDGARGNMLQVPNTSVTILDLIPCNTEDELWDRERSPPVDPSLLWKCNLAELTWTGHIKSEQT